jgi:hypothetical protein
MKKIRLLVAAFPMLFVILGSSAYAAAPAGCVSAPTGSPKAQVLEGANQTGQTIDPCKDTGVNNIVGTIVNILSYVVGIAAIIVVLLAGFKYITAGGDSGKISSAKNTLVYAIVGLVIAALAQVIVHTVFNSASNASSPPPKPASITPQPGSLRVASR